MEVGDLSCQQDKHHGGRWLLDGLEQAGRRFGFGGVEPINNDDLAVSLHWGSPPLGNHPPRVGNQQCSTLGFDQH